MKNKSRRKNPVLGDVYAIELEEGLYAFSVVCKGGDFAFFDYKSNSPVLPEDILEIRIAFRVPIVEGEPKSAGWGVVGNVKLSGQFLCYEKYLQKPIGSKSFYVYQNGESAQANEGEEQELEVLSAWYAFHIEDRLRDYFSGSDNKYVKAIKKQLGIP